jgi:hypothetical protein
LERLHIFDRQFRNAPGRASVFAMMTCARASTVISAGGATSMKPILR